MMTIKKWNQGRFAIGMLMVFALNPACDADQIDRYLNEVMPADPGSSTDEAACDENRTVYVMAKDAQYNALADAFETAGVPFSPLPEGISPFELRGAILFGSDLAGTEIYDTYMDTYAEALYEFVDAANLVVQLRQSAEMEPNPPFLPTTHGATNSDAGYDEIHVFAPDHDLMEGIAVNEGLLAWQGPSVAPGSFSKQDGFEVILSGDEEGKHPVMMEGAYGQGRFILSSLALDQVNANDNEQQFDFTVQFFKNIQRHMGDICRRDTAAVNITPSNSGASIDADAFTLIALPDTQVYSLRYPGLFDAQTSWIAEHTSSLNIRFVMQLGDLVNNNTEREWERARSSFQLLDGIVPYGIAPGNHDYGPSGDASVRETLLNDYFPFEEAAALSEWGGAFETGKLDDTYYLFEAGGRKWIVLLLEWAPRPEVVAWADDVMTSHPDHLGIMVTHAYLYNDNLRYDHTDDREQKFNPYLYSTPGGISDGEELWQNLIRRHHFVMTISGHTLGDGVGYLESTTDLGNTCYQMLSNYQMRDLGGEAYLRIIEIAQSGHVKVDTYSPLYDEFLDEPEQKLEFDL
jgi:hypothetical protein